MKTIEQSKSSVLSEEGAHRSAREMSRNAATESHRFQSKTTYRFWLLMYSRVI